MNNSPTRALIVAPVSGTPSPNLAREVVSLVNPDGTARTGRDSTYAPVSVAGTIGVAAKTTTDAVPAVNSLVPIVFAAGNSAASPTVTFATGSAVPIFLGGTAPVAIEATFAVGGLGLFFYDGTSLHQVGVYS